VLEFHKSVNGPARRTLDTAIGWPSYLDNPLLFLVSMASLAPQLVCTADVNKRSVKLKDAFNLAAAVAVLRGCKGKVLILCKLVGIATEADGDIARPLRVDAKGDKVRLVNPLSAFLGEVAQVAASERKDEIEHDDERIVQFIEAFQF
jgi:hypothetical protein